jgi:hypothetical protein
MAYTAETVNARIRNLRGDAVTAARVLLTHLDRAEKSRDLLATALDDLGMFASNRKAEVTDAEKTFDSHLVKLVEAGELDQKALREHLATFHVTTAEDPADVAASVEASAEAEAEAEDASDTTDTVEDEAPAERPRRGRKVKDAPQA